VAVLFPPCFLPSSDMNICYIFLLLLVVLSAYSESPQYGKPPDPLHTTAVTVCPNSSSDSLGVLAPVLPQGKMSVLSQNMVLPQNGVFNVVIVNCELANKVKVIINFVLNFEVKSFNFLTSTLIHGGEKLGWTIRLLLESLQHVLKMYTWSLSENQASIQFRCKLIGLLLRQSLFRKHDFALLVHRIYHDYQNLHFWHLNFFPKSRNDSHTHIVEHAEKSARYQFYGGGNALLFSSDELLPYASTDLHEPQYQLLQCVTKKQKQSLVLHDGEVLCNVPLNILAPKLTLKIAKELANLHDVYMPSKLY
jgi:hypothetical protein